MASQRQIEANRRNALKSTGPKSEAGKARVSMNALKHGLRAETSVIAGEDPAAFQCLVEDLFEELKPVGVRDGELVMRIAGLIWRLRRVPQWEAALYEYYRAQWEVKSQESDNALAAAFDHRDPGTKIIDHAGDAEEQDGDFSARQKVCLVGHVVHELIKNRDALNRLGRYEQNIVRQLSRAYAELDALQEKRATIDVEAND